MVVDDQPWARTRSRCDRRRIVWIRQPDGEVIERNIGAVEIRRRRRDAHVRIGRVAPFGFRRGTAFWILVNESEGCLHRTSFATSKGRCHRCPSRRPTIRTVRRYEKIVRLRGLDIVAYQDPLGASDPRIKVQVQRRGDRISADELRSFMAVLARVDRVEPHFNRVEPRVDRVEPALTPANWALSTSNWPLPARASTRASEPTIVMTAALRTVVGNVHVAGPLRGRAENDLAED
jgi:hypothetical protein